MTIARRPRAGPDGETPPDSASGFQSHWIRLEEQAAPRWATELIRDVRQRGLEQVMREDRPSE